MFSLSCGSAAARRRREGEREGKRERENEKEMERRKTREKGGKEDGVNSANIFFMLRAIAVPEPCLESGSGLSETETDWNPEQCYCEWGRAGGQQHWQHEWHQQLVPLRDAFGCR